MKKQLILFSIFLSSFVSAQSSDVFPRTREFFGTFYDNLLVPIFSFLLGPEIDPNSSELFFAKMVLFLILVSIIWVLAERMPILSEKRGMVGFISVAVSVLGVRFVSEEWVKGILLPYNTLGIALMTLFPLALYSYFVYNALASKLFQRIAWVFAGLVYLALYITTKGLGSAAWIYGAGAGVCILVFLFNDLITHSLKKMKIESVYSQANQEIIRKLRRDLHEIQQDFAKGIYGTGPDASAHYDKDVKRIMHQIDKLS